MCNFHGCINTRTDGDTWSFLLKWDCAWRLQLPSLRVSATLSAFVFLLFTWGQTLLTGITEGNESAFTDKLEWWIDPWFNSAGYQEQQISIRRVKHTHLLFYPENTADEFTFTYSIHHQVDSLLSWQWMWAWEMSLQLYCIHTITGLMWQNIKSHTVAIWKGLMLPV